MMVFGLIRTLAGSDYRSQGQRRQLKRMGREFLREKVDFLTPRDDSPGKGGLNSHPNATFE